ncbi:MAG: uroporphyrinogen-III C-methyltransferase [Candidatus Omnitrophica bacterium]|nr:uroporphyrinogen-III C-methyltransferase [Candidatus Omnitrophota bacterium]
MEKTGTVYLIGAGPGGPDLLTLRGAQLLAQTDCVIYDRLVDARIVEMAAVGSERIDVGKNPGEKGKTQPDINALLVKKARQYKSVVRLKGGDPLLFGRIAEEMTTLRRAGISYEIVPGISSVQAASAYAGIPLTERTVSSSLAIVTGQESAGKKDNSLQWRALAKAADTLVVLMGRERLPFIVQELRKGGRAASTPVALVRWAARPEQSVLVATLETVDSVLAKHPAFTSPMVMMIGEVVRLREDFQWWKRPPLAGQRIVVTRAESDSSDLANRLQALGASCVEIPAIAVTPRRLKANAEAALAQQLSTYDWVIFTSAHGVKALTALLARQGKDARAFGPAKVCAIGPKTAATLEQIGITADLIPSNFSKQGVSAAFRKIALRGAKILIPRSSLAVGDSFSQDLRGKGAVVSEIPLYDTTLPQISKAALRQRLGDEAIDLVTFTSSSTVKNFIHLLEQAGFDPRQILNGARVAAIGPQTAAAAKEAGLAVHVTPRKSWTVDGLIQAIVVEHSMARTRGMRA